MLALCGLCDLCGEILGSNPNGGGEPLNTQDGGRRRGHRGTQAGRPPPTLIPNGTCRKVRRPAPDPPSLLRDAPSPWSRHPSLADLVLSTRLRSAACIAWGGTPARGRGDEPRIHTADGVEDAGRRFWTKSGRHRGGAAGHGKLVLLTRVIRLRRPALRSPL